MRTVLHNVPDTLHQDNVIPAVATAIVNHRLHPLQSFRDVSIQCTVYSLYTMYTYVCVYI